MEDFLKMICSYILFTMLNADSIPVRALSVNCSIEITNVLLVLKLEPFLVTTSRSVPIFFTLFEPFIARIII